MRRVALVASLLALLAAGCGGGGGSAGGETTTGSAPAPAPATREEPEAGKILDRFVKAAGARDYRAMFGLLSARTRVRFGPSEAAFARGTGKELGTALGLFRRSGEYKVVLSARATDLWAVAAISGFAVHQGDKEYGAYAVPLTRGGGSWKIELGGTVSFGPLTPDPELASESTPDVSTEITASEPILESRIWVDRTGIAPTLSPDELLLSGEVAKPLSPGRHTVITFAATQSSAGANAFVFTVR